VGEELFAEELVSDEVVAHFLDRLPIFLFIVIPDKSQHLFFILFFLHLFSTLFCHFQISFPYFEHILIFDWFHFRQGLGRRI